MRSPTHATTLLLLLLGALPAAAQSSPLYEISEHTINNAGHPMDQEIVQAGAGDFMITIDALGSPFVAEGLTSLDGRYRMGASFPCAYAPPTEVTGLRFDSPVDLYWTPNKAAGTYNLYRDAITVPFDAGYGNCLDTDITGNTVSDTDVPAPSVGWFYLVTVSNRLDEEGTKGFDTNDFERPNPAPCP